MIEPKAGFYLEQLTPSAREAYRADSRELERKNQAALGEAVKILDDFIPDMLADECEPERPVELWAKLSEWADRHFKD